MPARLRRSVVALTLSIVATLSVWISTSFANAGDRSLSAVEFSAGEARRDLEPFLRKRLPTGTPEEYARRIELAKMRSEEEQPLAAGAIVLGGVQAPVLGSWTPLGPSNLGGRIRALLVDPTSPNILLAAPVGGGIWRSTDGGATWVPRGDLLTNLVISSLARDPRNPNVVYAGSGEGYFNIDAARGAGIFRSIDAGATWTLLSSTNTADFYYVQKLVVTRGALQRIYAVTRAGVMRSIDAGATWQRTLDATAQNGCFDLVVQTDRPLASVLAACGSFVQGHVYRALDTSGVQSWQSVHAPTGMGRTSLALAPSNQSFVYALAASVGSGTLLDGLLGVYRSTISGDGGSWTTQVSGSSAVKLNTLLLTNPFYAALTECGLGTSAYWNSGWFANSLAVDPLNPDIVWAGGVDLFRSNDGGRSFGQASHWWLTPGIDPEYAHEDQHAIAFHPNFDGAGNKTMYAGNGGGVFRTDDARALVSFSNPITPASPICGGSAPGVVEWQSISNGIEGALFNHGEPYPEGEAFLGGTQDNGIVRGSIASGSAGWSVLRNSPGGRVGVNFSDPNMIWVENSLLSIARSSDGGGTFSSFTSGITEPASNFAYIAPFVIDPNNVNRIWIAGSSLWRTANATATPIPVPVWSRASSALGWRAVSIAVAPSDSNRVYVGGVTGWVATTSIATSATSATAWPMAIVRSGGFISSIAVHPLTPTTAWATVATFDAGASQGHVFKTVNGGVSWTRSDGVGATGIPDIPANSIVIDPNDGNRLFAGTDIGLYVSLDGGASWAREDPGLGNALIETLAINSTSTGTRYLFAFTHGRGAWRTALP